MSRTLKNADEKREIFIRFRMTTAEKQSLKQAAAREGLTISDYIRRGMTGDRSAFDRNALIRLLAEAGKQGSNLNQIGKACNLAAKTGEKLRIDQAFVERTLKEVNRLIEELLNLLKHDRRRKAAQ